MIKILISILLFGVCSNICAQSNTAKHTLSLYDYDTCQYLQQFAGEWKYINGNDTIKFYFRVHKDSSETLKYISTRLFGWVEYKKGNNIVESNYQNRWDAIPYFADTVTLCNYSILLGSRIQCNPLIDTLGGTIIDLSQSREMHVVKTIINRNSSVMTMTWKQNHSDGYGVFTGARGMTLPKEFILTKQ